MFFIIIKQGIAHVPQVLFFYANASIEGIFLNVCLPLYKIMAIFRTSDFKGYIVVAQ